MKIKGREVYWMSADKNVAITFSQFALGGQYAIYHARDYKTEDDDYVTDWEYVITFATYCEALRYANQIHDVRLYA